MSLCHDPNALHTKIFNNYSICRSENLSKDCISYVINNHKDQDVPEQMLREHLVKMDKYINSYETEADTFQNDSKDYYQSLMGFKGHITNKNKDCKNVIQTSYYHTKGFGQYTNSEMIDPKTKGPVSMAKAAADEKKRNEFVIEPPNKECSLINVVDIDIKEEDGKLVCKHKDKMIQSQCCANAMKLYFSKYCNVFREKKSVNITGVEGDLTVTAPERMRGLFCKQISNDNTMNKGDAIKEINKDQVKIENKTVQATDANESSDLVEVNNKCELKMDELANIDITNNKTCENKDGLVNSQCCVEAVNSNLIDKNNVCQMFTDNINEISITGMNDSISKLTKPEKCNVSNVNAEN